MVLAICSSRVAAWRLFHAPIAPSIVLALGPIAPQLQFTESVPSEPRANAPSVNPAKSSCRLPQNGQRFNTFASLAGSVFMGAVPEFACVLQNLRWREL